MLREIQYLETAEHDKCLIKKMVFFSCNIDWAKFDEVPMEVAPDVTQPLPWMTESLPGTTDLAADSWANFDVARPVTTKLAEDGWADFAAFSDSPAPGNELVCVYSCLSS